MLNDKDFDMDTVMTMTIEQLESATSTILNERNNIVNTLNAIHAESLYNLEMTTPLVNKLNILNERYHRILAILKKRVNPQ